MPKPQLTQYLFILSHATLFRNTRFITAMNPYAELNIGGNIRKTKIAKDAGTHPVWNQQLKIKSYGGSLLRIQIKDQKDQDNELICEGIVDLKVYGVTCELEENLDEQFHNVTVQLSYEGKKCGEIFMIVQEIKERRNNNEKKGYAENQISNDPSYGKQNLKLYPNKDKIFKSIARDNILNDQQVVRVRSHKQNQSPSNAQQKISQAKNYYYIRSSRQISSMNRQVKRSQNINIPLHKNGIPTIGFRENQKASLRY